MKDGCLARLSFGERVICRSKVRKDGTFPGQDVGYVLVRKGDVACQLVQIITPKPDEALLKFV